MPHRWDDDDALSEDLREALRGHPVPPSLLPPMRGPSLGGSQATGPGTGFGQGGRRGCLKSVVIVAGGLVYGALKVRGLL